jgi:serine O-acetyltransferase
VRSSITVTGVTRTASGWSAGGALAAQPALHADAAADLRAVRQRDPACQSYLMPYLFYKGYHALQLHRVAHWHWNRGQHAAAYLLQHRCSEVLAIDIHPAARIGCGILLDHGTGFVAGETSVIEDDVNLLHGVTLGGRGAALGDRHPKVRRGASLGAGVKVLGNIEIGAGAKVGAGSIVLAPIPSAHTAVGIPAHVVVARVPEPLDAPWRDIPATTGEHRERTLKPVLDGA